MFFYINAILIM